MKDIDKKVFSEVYDIIYHMDKGLYNKIPKQFLDFIKENKDNNYIVNIDYSKNINGLKIDLLKNFRSRKEVLNDINISYTLSTSLKYQKLL